MSQIFRQSTKYIFIYGTGTFARDVFDILIQHSKEVSGFLDHNPCQALIQGLAVVTPDSLSPEMRNSAKVIIGIHNRDANIAAIISQLQSYGYSQIITPVDLYEQFPTELGVRYWLTKRSFYENYIEELNKATYLFADQLSQDIFTAILKFRRSGDYSFLPTPDTQRQYFPTDLPLWRRPMRLIDCGAYDGDTLKSILELEIPLEAVTAYEPDLANYQELAKFVQESCIPNATLFPCGVYSSTTQLRFATGKSEGSVISTDGDSVIQCVSLDESIPDFTPTLIKMDIEGTELEALYGAEKTIAAFQPGLAICIYHLPNHLWEIPLWISNFAKKNNFTYNYYLRTYGQNCFDTVFYAIPN